MILQQQRDRVVSVKWRRLAAMENGSARVVRELQILYNVKSDIKGPLSIHIQKKQTHILGRAP